MTQANDLDHLINELSVADQVLKTVDKAQKPDPVVEKVLVEKIVNVEKPIAVHREVKQQTSDDLLVFSARSNSSRLFHDFYPSGPPPAVQGRKREIRAPLEAFVIFVTCWPSGRT